MKCDIKKIVSGGQTGADRAGLDFAIDNGIPHSGWIPKGRLTEGGPLSQKYQLKETLTSNYEERTEKNVLDSDGTMIFCYGRLTGGSLYTYRVAKKHHRPVAVINLSQGDSTLMRVQKWLVQNRIQILNIAGSRASLSSKIYDGVYAFLKVLFKSASVSLI